MAKSTLNLASRTAVVIGGTSGIGLALATELAEAGVTESESAGCPMSPRLLSKRCCWLVGHL